MVLLAQLLDEAYLEDLPFIFINGVKGLSPKVWQDLVALAPETAPENVIIIDKGVKPASASYIYGLIMGGVGAILTGVGLLITVWVLARRATPSRPAHQ